MLANLTEPDNLLLVVFTCNHCPYAKASWPTLIDLQKRYAKGEFQAIAVNPNNNPAFPDDRFEAMKPYAESIGLNFPYLFDGDQKAARAYGAECTPDPYLFKDGALYYHGRINDNWQKPEAVKEKSLEPRSAGGSSPVRFFRVSAVPSNGWPKIIGGIDKINGQ